MSFFITGAILEALFLFFSYIIYRTLAIAFGLSGWVIALPLFVFSGLFIITLLLISTYEHTIIGKLHRFIMYWIGLLGFSFGACLLFVLLINSGVAARWSISPVGAGVISFGIAVMLYIYSVWQGQRAEVTSLEISLPNVPEAWKGKKIVFVSDLHLGPVRRNSFARKIVRNIQDLKPEVILIGGDLFDGVKFDPRKSIEPLKELSAPLGVYFISGNHDYMVDSQKCFAAITSIGIRILHNEIVDLKGIDFIGVDFRDTETKPGFESVMQAIPIDRSKTNILVKHVPDYAEISAQHGMSVQLSGHTHNGQIWPLSYCGYFFKEFYYGNYQVGNTKLYVSSGVGTTGTPVRLGTRSEIVSIILK